ncbi:uncharacterized protein APUU_61357A [Aspergillus puulaauensis]|uniref:Uncharacterized protein n=1 Tax=Aspergillus puulaauensis TaxID=1220207 RepID=A0A7R7XVM1_9EURO|nr:uncharacterized protein APUU_61357A [Aspergillus puulaauensis]BCS28309.1 hypothetical protein APUU_61357A [Aspergillus puulaauensis]
MYEALPAACNLTLRPLAQGGQDDRYIVYAGGYDSKRKRETRTRVKRNQGKTSEQNTRGYADAKLPSIWNARLIGWTPAMRLAAAMPASPRIALHGYQMA